MLFNNIWKQKETHKEWSRGIFTTVPKRDLSRCPNCITLLPVPSKILGNILINRIKKEENKALGKDLEQVGFRQGRRTAYQIFIQRNIIEQCVELQATLCINLINFQKTFWHYTFRHLVQTNGFLLNTIKTYDNNKRSYTNTDIRPLSATLRSKFEVYCTTFRYLHVLKKR